MTHPFLQLRLLPTIFAVVTLAYSCGSLPTAANQLPDFREIVKANRESVVNITVTPVSSSQQSNEDQNLPQNSPFGDNYKKFHQNTPNKPPQTEDETILGSGFFISTQGHILTSAHVVKNAKRISIKLSNFSEKQAKLVGLDERTDVAVLKIQGRNYRPVTIGDSNQLEVGEWVLAIGSPFGLELTATQGIVSALGRSLPSDVDIPFIQTDVAVNPGNSGGPLFNTQGEVVGMNAQIYSETGNYIGLSFAIPISIAMQVSEQLSRKGFVEHGWLGVIIQPVTQDLALAFGLDKPQGALITEVIPGGPAAKTGLLTGDIIVAYNNHPVRQASDLPYLISATKVGKVVPIKFLRQGISKIIDVTIELFVDADLKDNRIVPGKVISEMGILVQELSALEREELGVGDRGVLVRDLKSGPAAEAGLRPVDIILAVDHQEVKNVETLEKIVDALPKKKPVAVLVLRNDSLMFLAMTLVATP